VESMAAGVNTPTVQDPKISNKGKASLKPKEVIVTQPESVSPVLIVPESNTINSVDNLRTIVTVTKPRKQPIQYCTKPLVTFMRLIIVLTPLSMMTCGVFGSFIMHFIQAMRSDENLEPYWFMVDFVSSFIALGALGSLVCRNFVGVFTYHTVVSYFISVTTIVASLAINNYLLGFGPFALLLFDTVFRSTQINRNDSDSRVRIIRYLDDAQFTALKHRTFTRCPVTADIPLSTVSETRASLFFQVYCDLYDLNTRFTLSSNQSIYLWCRDNPTLSFRDMVMLCPVDFTKTSERLFLALVLSARVSQMTITPEGKGKTKAKRRFTVRKTSYKDLRGGLDTEAAYAKTLLAAFDAGNIDEWYVEQWMEKHGYNFDDAYYMYKNGALDGYTPDQSDNEEDDQGEQDYTDTDFLQSRIRVIPTKEAPFIPDPDGPFGGRFWADMTEDENPESLLATSHFSISALARIKSHQILYWPYSVHRLKVLHALQETYSKRVFCQRDAELLASILTGSCTWEIIPREVDPSPLLVNCLGNPIRTDLAPVISPEARSSESFVSRADYDRLVKRVEYLEQVALSKKRKNPDPVHEMQALTATPSLDLSTVTSESRTKPANPSSSIKGITKPNVIRVRTMEFASGIKTYQDFKTAYLLLNPTVDAKQMPGDYGQYVTAVKRLTGTNVEVDRKSSKKCPAYDASGVSIEQNKDTKPEGPKKSPRFDSVGQIISPEAAMPGTITQTGRSNHFVPILYAGQISSLPRSEDKIDFVHITPVSNDSFVTTLHFFNNNSTRTIFTLMHPNGQFESLDTGNCVFKIHPIIKDDLVLVSVNKFKTQPRVNTVANSILSNNSARTQVSLTHRARGDWRTSVSEFKITSYNCIQHQCDSTNGTCGAPLFNSDNHVVGIHRGTTSTFNIASNISNDYLAEFEVETHF